MVQREWFPNRKAYRAYRSRRGALLAFVLKVQFLRLKRHVSKLQPFPGSGELATRKSA